MALPDDLVAPMMICMNPGGLPSIPGIIPLDLVGVGLGNFALSGLLSMFAGMTLVIDAIADLPDLPSLPLDPALFIDPFLASLAVNGDLGEIDMSLVIPGAPVIPATGPNIAFDQTGLIKLILMSALAPLLIITGIFESIIDLSPALPDLSLIITILTDIATSLGLTGVTLFITCFATALFDLMTALSPI